MLSTAEELREVSALIHALESEVRHRRHMIENTERWEQEMRREQIRLANTQKRIDHMNAVRDGGEEAIYPMFDRIEELKQRRAILRNKAQVEKVLTLQAALLGLQSELDPETLANLAAMRAPNAPTTAARTALEGDDDES